MPKAGSKRKKIVTGVLVLGIVVGGGFYYQHSATLRREAKIREANKDILTAAVEKDAVVSTVVGSGILENGDLEEVLVPVGLVVDEILVKTGDMVEPGQTLATLEPYSVDKALRKEQARLEALDKELEDLESEEGDVALTSPISGRVKTIYANTGADASEICREHGSLLSLSGDGKLALDLPASGLSSGDRVVVEGSSSVNGTVDVIRGRSATITVDDGSFREGETVSVFSRDKSENLGSGRLYIHQPLYLTAPQGTVGKLYVKENALVDAGEELLLLEDAASTADKEELLADRKEILASLGMLREYQRSNALVAKSGGIVNDIYLTEGEEISKTSPLQEDVGSFNLSSFSSLLGTAFHEDSWGGGVELLGSRVQEGSLLSLSYDEEWDTEEVVEDPGWEQIDSWDGDALTAEDLESLLEEGLSLSPSQSAVGITILPAEESQGETYLDGMIALPFDPPRAGNVPMSRDALSSLLSQALALEGKAGLYYVDDLVWTTSGAFTEGELALAFVSLRSDVGRHIYFYPDTTRIALNAPGQAESAFLLEDQDQDGHYETLIAALSFVVPKNTAPESGFTGSPAFSDTFIGAPEAWDDGSAQTESWDDGYNNWSEEAWVGADTWAEDDSWGKDASWEKEETLEGAGPQWVTNPDLPPFEMAPISEDATFPAPIPEEPLPIVPPEENHPLPETKTSERDDIKEKLLALQREKDQEQERELENEPEKELEKELELENDLSIDLMQEEDLLTAAEEESLDRTLTEEENGSKKLTEELTADLLADDALTEAADENAKGLLIDTLRIAQEKLNQKLTVTPTQAPQTGDDTLDPTAIPGITSQPSPSLVPLSVSPTAAPMTGDDTPAPSPSLTPEAGVSSSPTPSVVPSVTTEPELSQVPLSVSPTLTPMAGDDTPAPSPSLTPEAEVSSSPTPSAIPSVTLEPEPSEAPLSVSPTAAPIIGDDPSSPFPTGMETITPTVAETITPTAMGTITPTPTTSPIITVTLPTQAPSRTSLTQYLDLIRSLLQNNRTSTLDFSKLLENLRNAFPGSDLGFTSEINGDDKQKPSGLSSLLSLLSGGSSGSGLSSLFGGSSGLSSLLGGSSSGLSSLLGGGSSGLSSLLGGSGSSGLSSLLGGGGSSGLSSLLGGSGGSSGLSSLLGGNSSGLSSLLGGSTGSGLSSLGSGTDLSSLASALGSGSDLASSLRLPSYDLSSLTQGLGSASSLLSGSTATTSYQETPGFTLASGDLMDVVIQVNELDILRVENGQLAEVNLEALGEETFAGIVTDIGEAKSSSGNGGSITKYPVTITLLRDMRMRPGMNATASVTVDEKKDVLVLPADALQESLGRTFVYTQKTEEGELTGEVDVTCGISDDSMVEITGGISEGTRVYYRSIIPTSLYPFARANFRQYQNQEDQ